MASLSPETWGPSLWRAVHFVALGYPTEPTDQDVAAYRSFFKNLHAVVPCEYCSANYRRHLDELPMEPFLFEGRLFEWTVQLHNIVDKELGKAKADWTVEEAKAALLSSPSGAAARPPLSLPSSSPSSAMSSPIPPPPFPWQQQQQQKQPAGGGGITASAVAAVAIVLLALAVAVALLCRQRVKVPRRG
jgi:hypothetical protein